jgi:hypothetical protein
VSEDVSYDVYVRSGVDSLGRDEFGDAVAHFVDRDNAVALKRRLEARGETVHIEKGAVHGLSESGKERWFSDYSRIPEFEPPSDQALPAGSGPSRESSVAPQSAGEGPERAEPRPGGEGPQTGADRPRDTAEFPVRGGLLRPWWRRVFGG